MASLSLDPNGNRTIQFRSPDGKRRSIRLGKVNKKHAESVRLKVEHLAAAAASRLPLDLETAAWVAGVGAELHGKLAAVGLIPRREASTLGAFVADYAARRRADGTKGNSVANIEYAGADLVAVLGAGVDVRDVTPAMADDVAAHYAANGHASTTAAQRLKTCKTAFDNAVRRGLADRNPFADVKVPTATPDPARQQYVTRADALRVIAVSGPEWRTTFALSRFAGLRAPSEVFSLRVADVDFAAGLMTVQSPKTERHPGGATRVTPIFPDLRPFLTAACERAAAAGSEYVVNGVGERARAKMRANRRGWASVSLSSRVTHLVRRAGLEAWQKPTHNMRSSLETDLMADHPIHVVCGWLGNSPQVALKHYLQTLDGDVAKALAKPPTPAPGGADSGAPLVQNPVLPPTANGCHGLPSSAGNTLNRSELALAGSPGQSVAGTVASTCGRRARR